MGWVLIQLDPDWDRLGSDLRSRLESAKLAISQLGSALEELCARYGSSPFRHEYSYVIQLDDKQIPEFRLEASKICSKYPELRPKIRIL